MPADRDALVELDSFAVIDPARRAEIRQWLASGWVFLAERDGIPLGYSVVHSHFFGRDFLELVMVGQPFRHQGVGTALIRHAMRTCRTDTLWTSTNRSNLAMQALLTGLGFIRSGQIDGLDADDPEIVFRIRAEAIVSDS